MGCFCVLQLGCWVGVRVSEAFLCVAVGVLGGGEGD